MPSALEEVKGSSRQWLNPVDSAHTGSITWAVHCPTLDSSDKDKDGNSRLYSPFVDASLSIADCSRRISLSFDIYSEKDLTAMSDKVALLIAEMTAFETTLKAAFALYTEQRARYEAALAENPKLASRARIVNLDD